MRFREGLLQGFTVAFAFLPSSLSLLSCRFGLSFESAWSSIVQSIVSVIFFFFFLFFFQSFLQNVTVLLFYCLRALFFNISAGGRICGRCNAPSRPPFPWRGAILARGGDFTPGHLDEPWATVLSLRKLLFVATFFVLLVGCLVVWLSACPHTVSPLS